ncbi:MAG: RDD family protein [Allosphingosinicella sp.]|uniref:RDD family protein n=1 Tax=Allosphingosinicella sp. TaxID=2823234 RepID=UPI003962DB66
MTKHPALYVEAERRKRRSLVTPEGIDLSLSLAGVGQRFGAFLIDFVMMAVVLVLLSIAAIFVLAGGGGEIAIALWLIGFFLLRNFYFILSEIGPRAATIGKRVFGLRVVARNGARLTADAVIARNLMREIEFYLPLTFWAMGQGDGGSDWLISLLGLLWAGLFLFFPLFNRDRLRVGDLLAGTWIIHAPKRKLGLDLIGADAAASPFRQDYRFTDAQLDVYGVFEIQTLEKVLRDDNADTISTVAATIRGKIDCGYYGDDRAFLSAYYEAARARMERGLLFGRRREHKHDR